MNLGRLWLASILAPGRRRGYAAPSRPNIVLIYVDDLGWRDLGVMGSEYYETPNIDALASQGIRFTQAYSERSELRSSAGEPPLRHVPASTRRLYGRILRARRRQTAEARAGREPDEPRPGHGDESPKRWPAAAMSRVTWASGIWGGPGFLPEAQGLRLGGGRRRVRSPPSYFHPYAQGGRSLPDLDEGADGEYLTDRLTDEAIRFLDTHHDRPFFLYLSHYGVHTPLQAKANLVQRYDDKRAASGHDNPTYAADDPQRRRRRGATPSSGSTSWT